MSANPNVQVQQAFVTAALSGDAAALRELAHPDFVLHEGNGVPFAGDFHGADGFIAFLGVFMETLEIDRLEPVRLYECADPDHLACEFDLVAKVRASGKPFVTTLVEIWKFEGGKVRSVKPHYFNTPES
jgi:ketosteroid isomerase-like protein